MTRVHHFYGRTPKARAEWYDEQFYLNSGSAGR